MGNNVAALRAELLLGHFPTIDSVMMCAIAGGVPHPTRAADHVRLGDIVVSDQKGVIQYDFVKRQPRPGRRPQVDKVRSAGHRPSAILLEMVRVLESDRLLGKFPWEDRILEGLNRLGWVRPDEATDILAGPAGDLTHPLDVERRAGQPRVFFGPVASANTLLKDSVKRDALRDQFGVKAVEMEGSGIVDATWTRGVGYLVVRGICDYCDGNKNDLWQRYAAVVAAGYVRALLDATQSASPVRRR
jgi:nucleoside phosphorylase